MRSQHYRLFGICYLSIINTTSGDPLVGYSQVLLRGEHYSSLLLMRPIFTRWYYY